MGQEGCPLVISEAGSVFRGDLVSLVFLNSSNSTSMELLNQEQRDKIGTIWFASEPDRDYLVCIRDDLVSVAFLNSSNGT